jgi:hypothetical protein
MSWQCSECGSTNDDSKLRCLCGYEIDSPLNDKQETLLENREGSIQEIEWHEVTIDESSLQTGSGPTVHPPRDILLSVMFSKPIYIFSWIALIGLSILRLIKWVFPFIGPPLEFLLLILIFCGIISANIAKRKGKSALLWFFNGLIAIGIPFLFALQILCFIIFLIITGGEL